MLARALALPLLAWVAPAAALSCGPLQERWYFDCRNGACSAAFRAGEVAAFGACGRRVVVDDVDAAVAGFLTPVVEGSGSIAADGVYVLDVSTRYWRRLRSPPGSVDSAAESLEQALSPRGRRLRAPVATLPPREIASLLGELHGDAWLTKSPDASVAAARDALEDRALREHASSVAFATTYWGAFAAALFALVHSAHLWFARLHGGARGTAAFAGPLGTQLALGLLGVASVFTIEFLPFALLLPAVVVIVLAEAWARARTPGGRDARI